MLEKLKLLLGITDDTMDSQLSAYLVEAQEYVEDYLERQLTKGEYEEYINMEYGGFNKIVVRNYPLESVESIENLDGTVIDVESVRAIKNVGEIKVPGGIPAGDYVVHYTGGYDPLPSWAQRAIIDTAANIHYNVESGGTSAISGAVKSEEIYGVAKVTYDTAGSSSSEDEGFGHIPNTVVDTLEKHKNRYA